MNYYFVQPMPVQMPAPMPMQVKFNIKPRQQITAVYCKRPLKPRKGAPSSIFCKCCKNQYNNYNLNEEEQDYEEEIIDPNAEQDEGNQQETTQKTKRIPLVLKCGHTICSICYTSQLRKRKQFFCQQCLRVLPDQFQVQPPINLDLYEIIQMQKEAKEAYLQRHSQSVPPSWSKVKCQNQCIKENCHRERLKDETWNIKWFCSEECMVVYLKDEVGSDVEESAYKIMRKWY